MPAAKTISPGAAGAKFARRASSAGAEYEAGVQGAASWQQAATAAKGSFATGVQEAIAKDRYGKGIARVGDAGWKGATLAKGPSRFSQGVAVAEQKYASQVAPFLEVIGRTDLPPRGPVGSEGNIQRVAAIARALRLAKTSR